MAYQSEVWGHWSARNPFGLDPDRPRGRQIGWIAVQFAVIFGGPLLALVTIAHYPPLVPDIAIYVGGVGGILLWFLLSFAFFGDRSFPQKTPLAVKLIFRAAWGMCMTGMTIGVVGIANGYGTTIVGRDVPVVGKWQTLERDPAARTDYLAVRAWPPAQDVVGLEGSPAVYGRVDAPVVHFHTPQAELQALPGAATVRLNVGAGRLGIPWFAGIDLRGG